MGGSECSRPVHQRAHAPVAYLININEFLSGVWWWGAAARLSRDEASSYARTCKGKGQVSKKRVHWKKEKAWRPLLKAAGEENNGKRKKAFAPPRAASTSRRCTQSIKCNWRWPNAHHAFVRHHYTYIIKLCSRGETADASVVSMAYFCILLCKGESDVHSSREFCVWACDSFVALPQGNFFQVAEFSLFQTDKT
jgi:hypothetical protein